MKLAALITASLAVLSSIVFTGIAHCVSRGDARRHWYCLACVLWGKRSN